MRKIKKGILFISLISFLFMPIVQAASSCDYETQVQLKKEASNVNGVYEAGQFGTGEYESGEEEDGSEYEITEPRVKVSIYNVTENIYVIVTEKNSGMEETYYYDDTDNGTITWERNEVDEVVDYEVRVYSNHSDCYGEELYNFTLKTPKYNDYSNEYFCQEQSDYYCQEFVTQDITLTREEMQMTYENRINQETPTVEEKKENFFQKYFVYIVVGIFLILGVASVVYIIRKQRSKVL